MKFIVVNDGAGRRVNVPIDRIHGIRESFPGSYQVELLLGSGEVLLVNHKAEVVRDLMRAVVEGESEGGASDSNA